MCDTCLAVASLLAASVSFLHGAARGKRAQLVRAAAGAARTARRRDERLSAAGRHASPVQANARAERVEPPPTETR